MLAYISIRQNKKLKIKQGIRYSELTSKNALTPYTSTDNAMYFNMMPGYMLLTPSLHTNNTNAAISDNIPKSENSKAILPNLLFSKTTGIKMPITHKTDIKI